MTNKNILDAFRKVANKKGLGNWDILKKAGLESGKLLMARNKLYDGPRINKLPNLDNSEKALLRLELIGLVGKESAGSVVSFGALSGDSDGDTAHLWQRMDLADAPLEPPDELQLSIGALESAAEKQLARTWNRYGLLLTTIADELEFDPLAGVAVLAAEAKTRGFARDGRLMIGFDPSVFYTKWGRDNAAQFSEHFSFDEQRPWQGQRWREDKNSPWQDCHTKQSLSWDAFTLARSLDDTAAKLATAMGLCEMMGMNHAVLGYQSVGQMFDAFSSSERYQVMALFDWITGNTMIPVSLKP